MIEFRYVIVVPAGYVESTAFADNLQDAIGLVVSQVGVMAESAGLDKSLDFAVFWPGETT